MNECNECRLVSLGLDRQAKCYVCLEAQVAELREFVEIVRELVGDYTITDKRLIKALEATK